MAPLRKIGRLGVLGAVAGLLVLVVSVGGCSVGAIAGPSRALTVGDAWVRASAGTDQPAAGYLSIVNAGGAADALMSASSPQAASVDLHQTEMASDGMMGMHPVTRLDVPAGGTVALTPGGYHLMISGLKVVPRPGDRLELDLVFEHAGTVVVQAEVR